MIYDYCTDWACPVSFSGHINGNFKRKTGQAQSLLINKQIKQ